MDGFSGLVWSSLATISVMGLVGTAALLACSHLLVYRVLRVPEALKPETAVAFWLLAFSVPVVTSTAGLRGVLEAQQEFRILSVIRMGMGVSTFIGPLVALLFSSSMVAVVAVIVGQDRWLGGAPFGMSVASSAFAWSAKPP